MAAFPDVPTRLRHNWLLPLFAGVCVLAATLVLADSVRVRERHHILHLTEIAGATVKGDIEADLEARFLAPVRTTALWEVPANVSRAEWQRAAHTFLSEHPNIFAVAWATPDGHIWSVPDNFGAQCPQD